MDDIKKIGKKLKTVLMCKKLMKLVDLGEATLFVDPVHLGCFNVNEKKNEITIEENRKMFQSRISPGATEIIVAGKASSKNFGVILRQGRTCSKIR